MSELLTSIENRRKELRAWIYNNRSKAKWYRPLLKFKLRRVRKKYQELGLAWGILRTGTGLNLTGATLLNDEGQQIDSETFKEIAQNKVFGKSSAEHYLKAEYDRRNVIVTRPDGTQVIITAMTGKGIEVPVTEVFESEE